MIWTLLTPLLVDDANKKRVASDVKVSQNLGLVRVLVRRAIVKKIDKKTASRAARSKAPHIVMGTLQRTEYA